MSTNTIPLVDVQKLEGLDIDTTVLYNSNLLLVKENANTKEVVQFSLKNQVLDKIDAVDARLGLLTYTNNNDEEINPSEGTVCYLVEDNKANIEQIWDNIGSEQPTEEEPDGSGILGRIKILEEDTNTLKTTPTFEGYSLQIINAASTSIVKFGRGISINCDTRSIPIPISTYIENFEPYSFDLEVTLSACMTGDSVHSDIKDKYVNVTTIFNLNSIHLDNSSKIGVIQLPMSGAIFVEFTIGLYTISFKNCQMIGMTNYNVEDLKINNVILHINKLKTAIRSNE